ncbi:Transcription factor WhiB [Dermatophilus congolensis]|uniref:Transcriptional regulator WhiB n=1 Tax=Dermatophilus congolensis TaxID=1863 RepID=A0A239VA70_9MICO|nr:WhiB family transcriptional regulator [Dermatophilus congolensis]SNV19017.1 Transcription factor WhiB [Dermatophilus congolensis]
MITETPETTFEESIEHWSARAWCRTVGPDELFVEGKAQQRAKRICRNCEVVIDCLAEALDERIEFGVWGGMTERERRKMLRLHPEVTDWKRVFEDTNRTAKVAG